MTSDVDVVPGRATTSVDDGGTPVFPGESNGTAAASPRRLRLPGTAVRLAAFHAVVLAAVLALVVFGLYRAVSHQTSAATTRNLLAEIKEYGVGAQARPADQSLRVFSEDYLRSVILPDHELLAVALPGEGLIGSAGSGPLLGSTAIQKWAVSPPTETTASRTTLGHTHYALVATPLTIDGRSVGTVIAVANLSRDSADERRVLFLAIGEALVALLAGVAGVYLLLRRLLRTVGKITDTAAGIGRGELDRRLGDQGINDEVGRLAATFDAMADRVANAMAVQRQLLSDVSHQLRTPLTVARGHLEVLGRTGADDPGEVHRTVDLVVDEIDHMRSLVERLLLLGRALEPDFLDPLPIDLRSFLADIAETTTVLAPRQWRASTSPDLVLVADPSKLRGALLNLVENAVHATARGDVVEIAAEQRSDGSIVLAVDDSGPGISPELRPDVLARFGRPGAVNADGSGLGLAIVKAVAEAHGGHVEIEDSQLGGCRVAIVLPPSVVVRPEKKEPMCSS